ncbi:MAG: hypothetical protein ABIH48_00005, partial [Candidatus Falkowbacteria bacterium]
WIIDDISYKETLEELIVKSKDILNPFKQRLIALGHGDGHEMNIYTNALNHQNKEHKYAYLDLETAGDNSVFGEGVIYLIYNSVMADYEIPKYYPEHFTQRNRAMNASFDHFARKKLANLQIRKTNGKIIMNNIKQFGTSPIRKEIAKKYISLYLSPVIQLAEEKFGAPLNYHIKNTLKGVFLMRLLGVYNVSQMQALDQAKIFGLLYKTIGTTNNHDTAQTILKRFIDSL